MNTQQNTNYKNWKISDKLYNQKEAWPKEEYPLAISPWIKDIGCFMFSICIMLKKYDVCNKSNKHNLNPLIFLEELKSAKLFDKNACLQYYNIDKVYPIRAVATIDYNLKALKQAYLNNYMCIVGTKSNRYEHLLHYVVLDYIKDSSVYIIDPDSNKKTLDELNKPCHFVTFEKI